MPKYTDVYTDGACPSNGQPGARGGVGVFFGPNNPLNVSAPAEGRPTSNNAEIQAAREAVEQAARAGIRDLKIHTDSRFLIDCQEKWVPNWKNNGWRKADGSSVKNRTELQQLDRALQKIDNVKYEYVKAHDKSYENNMADRLAKDGADQSDRSGGSRSYNSRGGSSGYYGHY